MVFACEVRDVSRFRQSNGPRSLEDSTHSARNARIPARWNLSQWQRMSALAFAAGQFNMLYVFGVGEVPISISGDPSRRKQRWCIPFAPWGAVTQMMCALKRHDVVGVRGPFGSHWPLQEAMGSDVVIVAGGLGLAPLRPAIYQMLAQRKQYGRVVLLYGARTPADLLYRRELARWGARADIDVQVTVDRGDDAWRGKVGVVPRLIPTSSV